MSSFFFYPSGILQRREAELRLQEDAGAFALATQFFCQGWCRIPNPCRINSLQLSSPPHQVPKKRLQPQISLEKEHKAVDAAGWEAKGSRVPLNPIL